VFNSLEERELLFRWSKDPPQGSLALALRCRIVIACADGYADDYVAQRFGVSEARVAKWRRRYVAGGSEGLFDKPRSGVPRSISDEQVEAVIAASLEERAPDGTHWTTRSMASVAHTSQSSVARIWKKHGVHPRQVNIFTLSADPEFVGRVRGVVGLYLNPPEGALVLGVEEGAAAGKDAPVPASGSDISTLPRRSAMAERPSDLHRALEVASGQVVTDQAVAKVIERDRDFRFRRFLQRTDPSAPGAVELHVVVDNSSTKMTDALTRLLDEHGRFHLHTAPNFGWWMYLIEWWLTELAATGLGPSATELGASINDWMENWNEDPSPFVWKSSDDQIGERLSSKGG
jgi:transposase